jgi:hypothetical protein
MVESYWIPNYKKYLILAPMGLDPRIHHFCNIYVKKMDPRVKNPRVTAVNLAISPVPDCGRPRPAPSGLSQVFGLTARLT